MEDFFEHEKFDLMQTRMARQISTRPLLRIGPELRSLTMVAGHRECLQRPQPTNIWRV